MVAFRMLAEDGEPAPAEANVFDEAEQLHGSRPRVLVTGGGGEEFGATNVFSMKEFLSFVGVQATL